MDKWVPLASLGVAFCMLLLAAINAWRQTIRKRLELRVISRSLGITNEFPSAETFAVAIVLVNPSKSDVSINDFESGDPVRIYLDVPVVKFIGNVSGWNLAWMKVHIDASGMINISPSRIAAGASYTRILVTKGKPSAGVQSSLLNIPIVRGTSSDSPHNIIFIVGVILFLTYISLITLIIVAGLIFDFVLQSTPSWFSISLGLLWPYYFYPGYAIVLAWVISMFKPRVVDRLIYIPARDAEKRLKKISKGQRH